MAKIKSGDVVDLITFSKSESKPGDIKQSMLSEEQFNEEHLGVWVLADGRSCSGTLYESITGNATVPDMRGSFLRGKDHGKGLNTDLALGTYQEDTLQNITGTIGGATSAGLTLGNGSNSNGTGALERGSSYSTRPGGFMGGTSYDIKFDASNVARTSTETRPKNVTVNFFIKVDY